MKVLGPELIWLKTLRESLVPKVGMMGRLMGKKVQPADTLEAKDMLDGLVWEGYRFGTLLGMGSVGAVFEVERTAGSSPFPLAAKVVNLGAGSNPEDHGHFERELEIGRRLDHPGIINVVDSLQNPVGRFLIMERATSQTLGDNDRPWSPAELFKVLEPVVSGLQHAHDQGVVHRDLKPENIALMKGGAAKVLDFGLSQLKDSQELTLTGQFKGTISYAAPEQFQDTKRVTAACDQFSFGMIIFEMLTSKPPYDCDPKDPMGAIMARLSGPAALLSTFRPETTDAQDKAMARMLAMDPAERYESIKEGFEALQQVF